MQTPKIFCLGLFTAALPAITLAGEIVPTAEASVTANWHASGTPFTAASLLAACGLLGLLAGMAIYRFLRAESALIAAHKSR